MFWIIFAFINILRLALQVAILALRFMWWCIKKAAYLIATICVGIVAGCIKLKDVIANAIYNRQCKKRWQKKALNA